MISLLVALALTSQAAIKQPPLEQPDQPWAPRHSSARATQGSTALGVFNSIQVNVDDRGQNIPGDAANEPSLAIDPTAPNRIVIGWRQFDTIQSNFRQAGYAYSSDGGRHWTFPGVLTPGIFRSDPVLDSDSQGNFYYNSLRSNFLCDVFTSPDGATWTGPMPAFGGDKAWMVLDRSGGVGDGNIYSAWSVFAGCCGDSTFTRSVDGGLSFSTPTAIPGTPIWGTMAVDSLGNLYVAGREAQDDSVIRVAKSLNAQNPLQAPTFAFSAAVELGGSIVIGPAVNPAGLLGQVNVGVLRSGEAAYVLASVDPPGPEPGDVMFAAGAQGGSVWSPPVRVNDDPPGGGPSKHQWLAAMSVAPSGRIDAVWNDTRNDPQGNFSQLFYSFSTDGGQTWAPNVPASPPFNHFVGYPQQNKLGDYYTMISDDVGANVAWAATFNGEQDVYYLRIGDYDCNGNGIPDGQDLEKPPGGRGNSDDCNGNGIPDECDIASGVSLDVNGDEVPDECAVEGDINGDGVVNVEDMVAVVLAWGPCPALPAPCPADLDGNGAVDVEDLVIVVLNWD